MYVNNKQKWTALLYQYSVPSEIDSDLDFLWVKSDNLATL